MIQYHSADSLSECGPGVFHEFDTPSDSIAECENWTGVPGLDARTLAILFALLGLGGLVALRRRAVARAAS